MWPAMLVAGSELAFTPFPVRTIGIEIVREDSTGSGVLIAVKDFGQ